MSDLSKKIVDLSPAKLELLARRLKEKGKESSQAQVIARRSESVLFPPLSFAQQRLWVLDQLEPLSPAYNIYTALRLSGRLDIDVLERALNEVIRRHEILRTTFGVFDDEPVQVIAEQLSVEVKVTDLRHLPEDEREAEVHRLATEGAKQSFDLTRGPLLHASWLQLGDESGVLLLTVPHIVFDGWSAGVFIREMVALYEAFSKGDPSPLAELPIQYADFSIWQRQKLQGEILERHVEYWKRQLGGAPPLLDLPTDRPRLAFQTYQGERLTFSFSDALIQQLKSLTQREGATLFMTLLSAFQIMLFRYTGQSRISVGTAIANRNRRELEPLIGFFANTLVLCTDLSGDPTFRELLSRVQEVTLGAYSHQDLPFEKVVDVLRPVRDLSHNPLFQVMFIFNTVPTGEAGASQNEKSNGIGDRKVKPPDLAAGLMSFDNRAIKRDLSLSLLERAEGVAGILEYSTDLFDAATVSRMISHFTTLLAAIVAEPDQRISELPMLTEKERQQLLTESTGTKIAYQKGGRIHQLFEAQVERTPDSVAVIFEDERLTYGQLNRRANQLARHLRTLGVGPDTLVGIFMHRSLDVVISILGVLKAGGAYVPLDPAYPKERLNFVLEDAQPPVLLSHKNLMETGFDYQSEVLLLDADWHEVAQHSEENLSNIALGCNLAYVIYTSGSTGRPKGVTIPHAALTHYVQAMEIAVNITAGDCYLHTASTGFSSSVRQLMVPLSVGAAVVVATPEQIKDPLDLFDSVKRSGVTIMDIVPSYYRNCIQILASLTPESKAALLANKLRLILTASEPLWSDIVRNGSFEFDPGTRFINMFGQTETTGIVTVYPIPTVHEERVKIVPIGKPIANTAAYVLDQYLTPAPVGVHGELCVGGPALARGYLNHSELTAEKFIPDPFNKEPGARLYRTGDLARYLPDGNIEFIGRSDRQVKIRGFRVEPEEIEAVLVEHPSIRAAVVVAHEYLPGNKRLVAYVVASQEPAPGFSELRDYLKKRLPEYMVPPSFMMLDELPVMPNGKVNRQALPALDQLRPDLETKLVDPRTPVEETLAGIWARVLGVERVGINDNFFELGGHSLLATQAISRVREAINVEVSLRQLFEHPTITGLADVIEAEIRSGRGLQSSPIRPVSREENLPLSFAQQRLWFLDQLEPNSSFYNISASVRLQGQLDVTALDRALNEVVRRHEILRTRFAIINDQPVQIIDHAFRLSLPVVDLSQMPESERTAAAEQMANEESQKPFDLAVGPLVRATLVKIDQDEYAVIVVMHHIVSDGWSRGVLIREVSALYKAYSAGERSPLPELPVQYADYAVWQREWLKGEVLDAQLDYWKKQLEGAPPLLELPTDRPMPLVQTYRGAQQTLVVPTDTLEKLEALSRQEGATLFMVLLAGFQILLARYSGQKDILIGTPIAGRNRTELEHLIGFFINTLVIRADLGGKPSFRDLLRQMRAVSLESYAYQDLPLEKLIDELKLRRDLSHTPLFQVMFALWTQIEVEVETTGLKSRGLGSDTSTAKFNLVLNMTRSKRGLSGVMRYNTDLFDEATIERMIGHFGNLVESVANDREQQVMMIPLMAESERLELLTELNEQRQYPDHSCLHELFEQQAEQRPEAVAVTFENQRLSYKELNERANQLAHHLRSLGVAPDTIVGLCIDRSLDLIVAMLAILKAGGAYLPIDPAYPQDRIAFMLEDSEITVLITQDHLVNSLPDHEAKLVRIDEEWHEIAQQSRENPKSETTSENMAYIIYTSGSTGQPKGVMVTHSNVVRLLRATEEKFGFRETDVWTMFHSASFDFSVWELWGGLCYGGKVVVVDYWMSRTAEAFYEMVESEAVTVLNQTPSAFRQFMQIDEERAGELRLRVVIFGGEALEVGSLRGWVDRHGDEKPELVNMYGITETTVHVTYRRLRRSEIEAGTGSVIGGAIGDLRVYILDEEGQVVPEGVGGEIYVGGRGLARGYKGRAELTAERFVPDEYSGEAGGRLYKSGDRGRYVGRGEIEYLGRIDNQVKIRGFRIELGEIETVLSNHPQIDEAVVLAHTHERGEKRLIAYLVSKQIATLSISELRTYISEKLPEYMQPSQYIYLESMPLTVNGKIDRRALPEPTRNRPELEKQYEEASTEIERVLVELWEQSLGVERIGINDNFFELGGDSIQAAIMINRLQEVLGEYVYVVAIFDAPTVAQLSEYLVANYPRAVNRMCGIAVIDEEMKGDEQIDERKIEQIRSLIKPLRRREGLAGRKNRPAVFILSAPRSGSTLLRVMLAGHSRLFAPPELELLRFNTLRERSEEFEGRNSFWLEGTLRAMMEAKGISLDEARELMSRYEEEGMSVKEFYAELQGWIGERMLVDKSPSYALNEEAMRRGEEDFEGARYIHLIRHPMGMIKSFEEAKLEQVFFQYEHEYGRRELAELIWVVSNENIGRFLEGVEEGRKVEVRYEELVREPREVMERVSGVMGVEVEEGMVEPYKEKRERMTDGVKQESRMLGDVKFHEHTGIDREVADRWKQMLEAGERLSAATWRIAERYGYERPEQRVESRRSEQFQPIKKASREKGLALSFAQQRLWFLDQLEPNSSFYNIAVAVRLDGDLNTEALEQTFNEIISRHEILRTTFEMVGGQPLQVIQPSLSVSLEPDDLSEMGEAEREGEASRMANIEAKSPFDLARGPLLRVSLIKLADLDHVLLVSMHHIISDGWSVGVLIKEVALLYEAYCAGKPSPLSELPIQYGDYAVWQREYLQGAVLDEQIQYWKHQLQGAPPVLEMPTDRPRPALQSYKGGRQRLSISKPVAERLEEIGQKQEATIYMVLMAAFQVLLMRYSGQKDIVVGTPIAGRTRGEVEGLIGFFVNTLVMRSDLRGNPGFAEMVRRVRGVALGAYAHQEVPFERLVDELGIERDLSHAPVFQVMMGLANAPRESQQARGLKLSSVGAETETAKFDLTVMLTGGREGVSGSFKYNTDLFDEATIERMIGHFGNLVESVANDREQQVMMIPLMAESERLELLTELNEQRQYPDHSCLHELFEQQAEQRPEAVAVTFENQRLSYKELNERANQLAHHLRSLGVGPDLIVGLCVERSLDLVVGMLGILKAGGAYLPIDPAYPQERIAFMLEDSDITVLITQDHLVNSLPDHEAKLVRIDEEWHEIAQQSRENPKSETTSENMAYIIYTSGSTGRPKGVMVTHSNVVRLLRATEEKFGFRETDVWTMFHSASFDFSVWELWGGLCYGGKVVVVDYWVSRTAKAFYELVESEAVTVLNQTPSAFGQFMQVDVERAGELRLRVVIFGGEALEVGSLRGWVDRHGDEKPELVNMYGITETTVHVTYRRLRRSEIEAGTGSVIGGAIGDLRVYILDEEGQVVPEGVGGEIYVGGRGLARGYKGRAELTAERFVPDPYGEEGGRLYKSGDRGRYVGRGEIEYLGRIDNQVKIRGFRIELGEIETVLSNHPQIDEAVVLAHTHEQGEKRLIAYLISKQIATPSISELRTYISEKLPEYMQPSQYIYLESMPLTVNGKIDRRALPEPTRNRPELEKQYEEASTEIERQLVELWEQSLGVERIGINDNFFELGGDSILAAIFINKLQEVLGEYVYVVAIFDAPTVAQLSEYLVANYPRAVNRMCGVAIIDEEMKGDEQIDERKIEQIRGMIKPLRRREGLAGKKNRPAVFILSAPRSGSTLLRVMLAGHSRLFAPPELELLRFNTLRERSKEFEGRNSFWLEGTLRAMMEAKGISLDEARQEMSRYEEEGMSVKEFYAELQGWIGERMLVDKSPSYAMDVEAIRRGEEDFEGARYIHLIRHPMGMIKSFEEAKLEQVFFQYEHEYGRRELAELIWIVSNENIGRFLEGVEEGRKVEVRYEELVREPREVMERVSGVMGVEVEEGMVEPYKEKRERMTDGVKQESRMLGDVKFHEHTGIDREVADRWKQMLKAGDRLSDITWGLAETFGYERPVNEAATSAQRLMPLKRVKPGQTLRLSYAQERLWFLDQLEPKSPFYNMAGAVRLRGELDSVALEETINEIVRRHEVLRTTFDIIDGQPIQIINPAQRLTMQAPDLSGLLEQERESELKRLVAEEAQQPFDLAKGPLMRVRLIRLGDGDNVLLLTRHHIISDGWSLSILIREMSVLYEAFSTGKPSPLAELTIQYADYAHSQREWLQGEVLDKQLEYWKRQLAEAPPVLELPTDHTRPPVQSFTGAGESVVLPRGLSDGLKELSRKEGTTLFMTLLAAFQAMLSRYSGQEKIVVGTPIASRNRAELENLIGLFLNMLALHTDLGGDPGFVELLHRVREVSLGAYAHQDLPFEKVVEELQPARDISRSPVFQVMFTLQNTPRGSIQMPGMKLNSVGGEAYTTKFDLSLGMMDREDGLVASLQYNTRLFEAGTIKRMMGHFQRLLESILSDPLLPLSLLPMLSPAERSQLLLDFNDTQSDFPRHLCIHHLFEAQAERTPDAVALVFDDQKLSYSELNQRSNQLAHYLQLLGVGPETLVGICMERSVEMVVSLLGILKSGGAYLPIDPYYPLDRISFMIEDSGLQLLLTQQQLLGLLGQQPAQLLCIDRISHEIDEQASSNPTCEVESDNAAYLIYTSGSTGRPKAVVIAHKAVVNFLISMEQKPGISSEDVLVAVTTLAFDIAGLEIYLPLIAGARIEIASREEAWDGKRLAERLVNSKATMMQATPASWRMLLEAGWRAERGFKVLCGGEGLAAELARQLKESGAEVWNLYGPTETTIWSGGYEVEEEERGIMPVGRPIANTQIYVLGDRGELMAIGARGEIYIGGEGLARGYAERAEQTAERFVPDAYSKQAGARMYRTGDEGRYKVDGRIEFIGRVDNQVKVRGYRVELGEIEEVLRGQEEVREAVVEVREDGRGEKELVGYVVEERKGGVRREGLIEYVSKRLPEYMVPKKYVMMKEMPLTGSGKVDRKALLSMEEAQTEMEQEYIAARTPTEEMLAGIWAEVLKVERVGIKNNFFTMGGHSLLATQLISRVRDVFQTELSLLTVFKSPTVEALAEAIEIKLIQSSDTEQMLEMMGELEHLSQDEIEALLLSEDFSTGQP